VNLGREVAARQFSGFLLELAQRHGQRATEEERGIDDHGENDGRTGQELLPEFRNRLQGLCLVDLAHDHPIETGYIQLAIRRQYRHATVIIENSLPESPLPNRPGSCRIDWHQAHGTVPLAYLGHGSRVQVHRCDLLDESVLVVDQETRLIAHQAVATNKIGLTGTAETHGLP